MISVGLRVAHRRTRTFLFGAPFSFSPGAVDGRAEYSALRLTGDWIERGRNQVVAASLTWSVGLEGTRSDIPGLPTPDRHWQAALARFSFARRLMANGLELRLRAAGQYADGLLYSGERIAAGGENSVRGYRETLLLGDTGLYGSAELALPFSLSGRRNRGFDWGAFTVSAFVDGATLHNRSDPQPAPQSVASVGASLAWVPSEAIFARVTFAQGLRDVPQIGSRDLQDRGFQFRLVVRPLALFRD